MTQEFEKILQAFKIDGKFLKISAHKSGHINDSYLSEWDEAGHIVRYIHQKINHNIFKDVPGLMRNIELVLKQLQSKIENGEAPSDFKSLVIVPTKSSETFIKAQDGSYWRSYIYIEGTETFDRAPSLEYAREGGRIFGVFQRLLADLPLNDLILTIPDFDNVPKRYLHLEAAVKQDPKQRAQLAKTEIEYARANKNLSSLFADLFEKHAVPKRLTHYDTKLNNVLFQRGSARAMCVADLDTCMPGCSLYDYGDLARNSSVLANEDERDLSKIVLSKEYYQAIRDGYLSEAKSFLSKAELNIIDQVPGLNALNLGVRFLTDFLQGDTYFKISYPDHNLVRARAQFRIAEVLKQVN